MFSYLFENRSWRSGLERQGSRLLDSRHLVAHTAQRPTIFKGEGIK
jgi:hypothetical protein